MTNQAEYDSEKDCRGCIMKLPKYLGISGRYVHDMGDKEPLLRCTRINYDVVLPYNMRKVCPVCLNYPCECK